MKSNRVEPGPNQESVWDYPRPPRVEDVPKQVKVVFNGVTLAETTNAKRVLETAGAPVYYIPPEDVEMDYLSISKKTTFCEWKGWARYYQVSVEDKQARDAGWFYPNPTPDYGEIKDYIAFYAQKMDACYVDGEKVRPQPGRYYGGWITKNVVGPFKGEPGSEDW